MSGLTFYAMSAFYAAMGTLLIWSLRFCLWRGYDTFFSMATLKVRNLCTGDSNHRFPEQTFSSTRLTIPGQVTTVEYDSSASSLNGKRPMPAVTFMREFGPLARTSFRNETPLDHREPPITVDDSSDDDSDSEHIRHTRAKSTSPSGSVADQSTQDADSDVVLSYRGGEVRGLEALAELLQHHWTASSAEESNSSTSGMPASSISQTLANYRRKASPAATSRRSRSLSRTSSMNPSPRTRSKSRLRSRNASPAPAIASNRSSSPPLSQSEATQDTQAISNNYVRRVVCSTAFFQSTVRVEGLVKVPEALSSHPALEVGDLFYHKSGDKCQVWVWESNNTQQLRWKPIGWEYERQSDHKVLILSEKKAIPSWVQKSHFLKHTQNHPDLQAMIVLPS